jgi:hypothetical protein
MKRIFAFALLLFPMLSSAQADYSKDVKSVDSIIGALYEVISGDAGVARDWERFKNLYTADAKLIPSGKNKEGKVNYRIMTPADYAQMFPSRVTTGFFERELHRVQDEFGTIVHVFSTYETRKEKDGPVVDRGINSIQLLYDGSRYFVMNIFWCAEGPGFTLPEKYTPK